MSIGRRTQSGIVALGALLAIGVPAACSNFGTTTDAPAVTPDAGGPPSPDASVDSSSAMDSAVDLDAAPDAAVVDAGAGCGSKVACERTVFVTKYTYGGDLGGVEGADQKCQAEADLSDDENVQGRRFIAWISGVPDAGGAVSTPGMRVSAKGLAPYVRPNKTIVAADWAALASAQHQLAINIDPFRALASNVSSHTWTGTAPDGGSLANRCGEWAGDAGNGVQGGMNDTTSTWSNERTFPCFTEARLYCIEK